MIKTWKEQPDFIRTGSIQWDSSWPESAKGKDRAFLLGYMYNRFGIPEETFDNYSILYKGKCYWFLRRSSCVERVAGLRALTFGMRAFQELGSFIKPTTRMIQFFGYMAEKAVLNIDETSLERLLSKEHIPAEMEIENGYVILSLDSRVLGLGLLINGLVRSQLPEKEVRFLKFQAF